jgi:hypothetical protein
LRSSVPRPTKSIPNAHNTYTGLPSTPQRTIQTNDHSKGHEKKKPHTGTRGNQRCVFIPPGFQTQTKKIMIATRLGQAKKGTPRLFGQGPWAICRPETRTPAHRDQSNRHGQARPEKRNRSPLPPRVFKREHIPHSTPCYQQDRANLGETKGWAHEKQKLVQIKIFISDSGGLWTSSFELQCRRTRNFGFGSFDDSRGI